MRFLMRKNKTTLVERSFEQKTLITLSLLFVGVLVSSWIYAMNLREKISANNSAVNVDVSALTEIEKIRNVADSLISNSRGYFLLGSSKLYEDQKNDKEKLTVALAKFEKNYPLPEVPEIIKRIHALQEQHESIFDQGLEFRAKQTESRIIGQFYQSKAGPIQEHINKALDEIATLHKAEVDRARAQAESDAISVQIQIPQGMAWLTALLSVLFIGMVLLVIRMIFERSRHVADRTRLYEEAKKAVQNRDEILSAISQDLKDPLRIIDQTTEVMLKLEDTGSMKDGVEVIKSSVVVIDGLIRNILDQTKADTGTMALRLDQLGIDTILDEAKVVLQPLAKQRDIRLEFNAINPPALAFFDRERIMRVLSNLIGNAIKFSPKNSKVVVKARSDQQYVYISVKDNGPGIPEKQIPGIFDHFWQARKTADQGTGIGLAIVKTIVEAHGGTVSVDSHVGHGSTFTFSLPKRRPAGANLAKPSAMLIKPATRSHSNADIRSPLNH